MDWLRDVLAVEPIECPRGWGPVSFVLKFFIIPPIFSMDRTCPIGGVESCSECRYPVNPVSAEELGLRLQELDGLRGDTLSEEEFHIRRRLIVRGLDPQPVVPRGPVPGQAAAMTALVLGPLGVVAIGAGWYFSRFLDPGFIGTMVLTGGAVLLLERLHACFHTLHPLFCGELGIVFEVAPGIAVVGCSVVDVAQER